MCLDCDDSHFKVMLNYLRYDLDINPSMLPKERKYLLELKKNKLELSENLTSPAFMQ